MAIDIDINNLPQDVEAGQEGRLPGGELVTAHSHPTNGGVIWRRANGHLLPGQGLAEGMGRKRKEVAGRFMEDLCEDWQEHGKQVFADCREKHPHMYLKVVASLIPKHTKISHDVGDTFIDLLKEMNRHRKDRQGALVDVTPTEE